jgi:mRNA-degrading endonuclease toxin of MazEF toxin-antitoxin module
MWVGSEFGQRYCSNCGFIRKLVSNDLVVIDQNRRVQNAATRLRASGLPQESVVNVSQLITLDKGRLTEKVGRLPAESLRDVEAGIRLVLAL